jgi:hypothetical protein
VLPIIAAACRPQDKDKHDKKDDPKAQDTPGQKLFTRERIRQ